MQQYLYVKTLPTSVFINWTEYFGSNMMIWVKIDGENTDQGNELLMSWHPKKVHFFHFKPQHIYCRQLWDAIILKCILLFLNDTIMLLMLHSVYDKGWVFLSLYVQMNELNRYWQKTRLCKQFCVVASIHLIWGESWNIFAACVHFMVHRFCHRFVLYVKTVGELES